ncbi:MAG: AAA family ATPase [Eubacterium sp.]|nr:AAA family ATPase [Eubacterium sp.]
MARKVAIGEQDFKDLIENNCFYVDKTNFIKEWWENRDRATLITRPRRFGKTLTMNMVDYFLSIQHAGRGDLFEGLSIWTEEKYRSLQGTYPVIFLSFAGIGGSDYLAVREGIIQELVDVYNKNDFLLDSEGRQRRSKNDYGRPA